MNWLEEWAKVEVIGFWICVGVIAIAAIFVIAHFVRFWAEDRAMKRRIDKRNKLLNKVFSKIKKGDVVYIKRYLSAEIEEAICESVNEKRTKISVRWKAFPFSQEDLYDWSYGKTWALTKEELERKKK